jgi:uncharacterized OB-fold protein/acyl dehydratase
MSTTDHSAALAALVGQVSGEPTMGPHRVNEPMIVHWAEAMGDANPVYVDDEAARAVGLDGIIAPPTMLQAWVMVGLKATLERESKREAGTAHDGPETANDTMMRLLDEEGLTSVVATNCEQDYERPLRVGEQVAVQLTIEAISDVKTTGLGTGRFATTRYDFYVVPPQTLRDPAAVAEAVSHAERIGSMRFRILKFAPGERKAPKPPRPLPSVTQDNAFFWEGLKEGELRIQRCTGCGALRHTPLPGCGECQSLEWDWIVSAGAGEIYSHVTVHYPQVPSFDYPLPIGLIELDEGTRIVANLDMAPEDVRIGMRVQARIQAFDDELSLPVFAPQES